MQYNMIVVVVVVVVVVGGDGGGGGGGGGGSGMLVAVAMADHALIHVVHTISLLNRSGSCLTYRKSVMRENNMNAPMSEPATYLHQDRTECMQHKGQA